MQKEEPAKKLAAALRARIDLVGDEVSRRDQSAHLEKLREISERIDRLIAQLPPPVHPQLQHFLSRCSYSKALEFLETETA